jgi:hypothetical protein
MPKSGEAHGIAARTREEDTARFNAELAAYVRAANKTN